MNAVAIQAKLLLDEGFVSNRKEAKSAAEAILALPRPPVSDDDEQAMAEEHAFGDWTTRKTQ